MNFTNSTFSHVALHNLHFLLACLHCIDIYIRCGYCLCHDPRALRKTCLLSILIFHFTFPFFFFFFFFIVKLNVVNIGKGGFGLLIVCPLSPRESSCTADDWWLNYAK